MAVASCRLRHGQSAFRGDSVGRNPTDRGKAGGKRSLLVEGGEPLSVVMAVANVHDTKVLLMTLERVVVELPNTGIEHLCLDKVYDNPKGHEVVAAHGWGRGEARSPAGNTSSATG